VIGSTSNLARFQPKHAALAAIPPHKKHEQIVRRITANIQIRNKLPRTQQDFYQMRGRQ